jgi:hypothetical protein
MNQNPAIAKLPVVERESQRSKIESAFRRVTVMTVEASQSDQLTQWFRNVRPG